MSTCSGVVAPSGKTSRDLEDAEELGLRVERHVADLVEEERAAVGQLDEAGLVPVRAGEGAAPVAEELALQEVVRDGRAVDRLEGAAPARHAVELARRDLFARPGLAEDDARQLGRRDALEVRPR